MRLGLDKRWFIVPAAPLISRGFYFALPTFVAGLAVGILGTLLEVRDPTTSTSLLAFTALGVMGLGFVSAYFEPAWLSPAWYRWFKREHGDILLDLAAEARRLGRREWLRRVRTQEDLERWVEDFRRNRRGAAGTK